ncbi:MAG: tetratricopeptide repeat protein [Deltaproteobacteria bacterium]|nr:MAG: tetratricopeptide repeat protein [Deltaproteobacteria bacterium]
MNDATEDYTDDLPELVAVEGPLKEESFPLGGDEFTIGQGEENNLVLSDPSISPSHAVIRAERESFVIRDLSGTGGTLVNGDPVSEERTLEMGDIIKIGSHELRFVERGEIYLLAPEQKAVTAGLRPEDGLAGLPPIVSKIKELGQTMRKRPLIPAASALIVIFLLIILLQNGSEKPKEPQPDPSQIKIQALEQLNLGMEHYYSQRWQEARNYFDRVLTLDPGNENAGVYQEKALREQENQIALNKGREYCEQGVWEDALSELSRIPEDSFYYSSSLQEREKVEEKRIEALIEEGKSLLKEKEYDQAKERFAAVLDLKPDDPRIPPLMAEVEKGKKPPKAKKPPPEVIAGRERKKDTSKATEAKAKKDTGKKIKPGGSQLDSSREKYLQGDLDGAVKDLEDIIARRDSLDPKLVKAARERSVLLSNAKQYYDKGKESYGAGNKENAITSWQKMLDFDRKLSGGKKSLYAKEVGPPVARDLAARGEEKFSREQYPEAFTLWKNALGLDPSNQVAKQGLTKLRLKAEKLYREGYTLEKVNREQAIQKYNLILKICDPDPSSPDEDYYNKAKRKLDQYR